MNKTSLITLVFLLLGGSQSFAAYNIYLQCFAVMPPTLLVYRDASNGKHIVVLGSLEVPGKKISKETKGFFLKFNDNYHSSDVELAVEFAQDPKDDRDALLYLVNNPNKIIERYSCRPYQ